MISKPMKFLKFSWASLSQTRGWQSWSVVRKQVQSAGFDDPEHHRLQQRDHIQRQSQPAGWNCPELTWAPQNCTSYPSQV